MATIGAFWADNPKRLCDLPASPRPRENIVKKTVNIADERVGERSSNAFAVLCGPCAPARTLLTLSRTTLTGATRTESGRQPAVSMLSNERVVGQPRI